MNFILKIIFFFFQKKKINKIGIYINEEYIFNHYYNLIKKLNLNKFEIILANKFRERRYKKFIDKLKSYSWKYVFLRDIYQISKYKILITHLHLGGSTNSSENISIKLKLFFLKLLNKIKIKIKSPIFYQEQYFQKKIGLYNIRFMYGVDVGASNFGKFNELYDEFFCHGPRDSKMVREKFNGKVFEMGYPRYDDFQKIFLEKNFFLKKFSCNIKKPTIVWLCTTSPHFSSIISYHKYIEQLSSDYNIILRPHPLEIDSQYDRYNHEVDKIINSSKLIINKDPFQNMSELYVISDLMICDYGGTIFSSIYMNKKVLLLNHDEAILDSNTNGSTSIEVRDYLPSINKNDCNNLNQIIKNIIFSEENLDLVKKARVIYFGKKKIGKCSDLLRERLDNLLTN